ncbi:MAG TPA: hypothetical protein PKY82_15175 [Pyrinomonadaceae bacterium]|nr:hypothetical protein [Pyrinomonadaceae bacterium]
MKIFINFIISVIILVCTGYAQTVPVNKAVEETLVSSENIVKNAPFSADVISENIQTLVDGNKIKNTFTSKMYRDSEGRFRREGTLNPGIMLTQLFKAQPVFHIVNPIEGVSYYLDSETKTAREMRMKTKSYSPSDRKLFKDPTDLPTKAKEESRKVEEKMAKVGEEKWKIGEKMAKVEEKMAKTQEKLRDDPKPNELVIESDSVRSEKLGTKQIEGVEVEGTRNVHLINAGAIGNEKPIEIVYERWYSKELQLIISSRFYDPRYGEQLYRLTNISRSNPEQSLFEVPKDYKILSQGKPVEIPKKITNDPPKPPRPPIEKRP